MDLITAKLAVVMAEKKIMQSDLGEKIIEARELIQELPDNMVTVKEGSEGFLTVPTFVEHRAVVADAVAARAQLGDTGNVIELTWTLGKSISADGTLVDLSTTAVSSSMEVTENRYFVFNGITRDINDVAYTGMIHEYDANGVWLRRTGLGAGGSRTTVKVGDDCASVKFVFGRLQASGVVMTTDALKDFSVVSFKRIVTNELSSIVALLGQVRDALSNGDSQGAVGLLDTFLLDSEVLD